MQLSDTLSLLIRRWWVLLVSMIVVMILALIIQGVRPVYTIAEGTVTITRVNRAVSSEFQYDNYYATQASEYMGNTVSRMFETGDFVQAVAERAGVAVSDEDALDFAKRFKVKQISSHLLLVEVRSMEADEAEKLLVSAYEEVQERIAHVEMAEPRDASDEALPAFSAMGSDVIVYLDQYEQSIVILAGLIAGLFVGLAIIVLEAALRSSGASIAKKEL